nr:proline-rich receptor-like protein kinase PERK3 isoform X1 [Ipomoea batatas]
MISRMESSVAAVAGGVGGALVLLGVILLVCFCMFHYKRYSNRNSDTASSDPSAVVEQKREGGSSGSSQSTTPRLFRMKELEHATRHFDEANLIGYGSFGLVFKGLLYDGTIVAIKRRSGSPRPEFSDEVAHLPMVQHRNVVNVLGYCQENGYQMLVFEYLPNGSVCSHLYGRISFNLHTICQIIRLVFDLNWERQEGIRRRSWNSSRGFRLLLVQLKVYDHIFCH